MGRWEPNARDRLAQAAMELYREGGFDQTTVAEIAARAGLTERTFFRHFADKREVLFGGGTALQDVMVEALATAAGPASPIDAVTAALTAGAAMLQERRDFARQRQAVIAATPELQERELIKMARLAAALATALRRRGVPDAAAALAAETGIAVFRVAFERWVHGPKSRTLPAWVAASMQDLRTVVVA